MSAYSLFTVGGKLLGLYTILKGLWTLPEILTGVVIFYSLFYSLTAIALGLLLFHCTEDIANSLNVQASSDRSASPEGSALLHAGILLLAGYVLLDTIPHFSGQVFEEILTRSLHGWTLVTDLMKALIRGGIALYVLVNSQGIARRLANLQNQGHALLRAGILLFAGYVLLDTIPPLSAIVSGEIRFDSFYAWQLIANLVKAAVRIVLVLSLLLYLQRIIRHILGVKIWTLHHTL